MWLPPVPRPESALPTLREKWGARPASGNRRLLFLRRRIVAVASVHLQARTVATHPDLDLAEGGGGRGRGVVHQRVLAPGLFHGAAVSRLQGLRAELG